MFNITGNYTHMYEANDDVTENNIFLKTQNDDNFKKMKVEEENYLNYINNKIDSKLDDPQNSKIKDNFLNYVNNRIDSKLGDSQNSSYAKMKSQVNDTQHDSNNDTKLKVPLYFPKYTNDYDPPSFPKRKIIQSIIDKNASINVEKNTDKSIYDDYEKCEESIPLPTKKSNVNKFYELADKLANTKEKLADTNAKLATIKSKILESNAKIDVESENYEIIESLISKCTEYIQYNFSCKNKIPKNKKKYDENENNSNNKDGYGYEDEDVDEDEDEDEEEELDEIIGENQDEKNTTITHEFYLSNYSLLREFLHEIITQINNSLSYNNRKKNLVITYKVLEIVIHNKDVETMNLLLKVLNFDVIHLLNTVIKFKNVIEGTEIIPEIITWFGNKMKNFIGFSSTKVILNYDYAWFFKLLDKCYYNLPKLKREILLNLNREYQTKRDENKIVDFIIKNCLLVTGVEGSIEYYKNPMNNFKYEFIKENLSNFLIYCRDTNNTTLCNNLLSKTNTKFYVEFVICAIKKNILTKKQHKEFFLTNYNYDKVITLMANDTMISFFDTYNIYADELLEKDVRMFKFFLNNNKIETGRGEGFRGRVIVNASKRHEIFEDLEDYFYNQIFNSGKQKLDHNFLWTTDNIADLISSMLDGNFIVNNILAFLKIAAYLPFGYSRECIQVTIVGPTLKFFESPDNQYLRVADMGTMNVPLEIIKKLVMYRSQNHLDLYKILMNGYMEDSSDNYVSFLLDAYNSKNYTMFDYLLDNPITIFYNDDSVISLFVDSAIKFYDWQMYDLLCKIFDRDLPDEARIEILGLCISNKQVDLFEKLLSKSPGINRYSGTLLDDAAKSFYKLKKYNALLKIFDRDLRDETRVEIMKLCIDQKQFDIFEKLLICSPEIKGFRKSAICELIKSLKFEVAAMLLSRQEMSITNFYDFDSEIRHIISVSENNTLKEYIKNADQFRSEVLHRLLRFGGKDHIQVSDVLTVDYLTLKLNLESEENTDENDECVICMDNYKNDDLCNILQCGHYMHKKCYTNACPYGCSKLSD